jgi:hypothetical protein
MQPVTVQHHLTWAKGGMGVGGGGTGGGGGLRVMLIQRVSSLTKARRCVVTNMMSIL